MITSRRKFGDLGEKVAAKYLKNKGYEVLGVNYQNKFGKQLGEIDIIARDIDRKELVFVEVKTRDLETYAGTLPEENITAKKIHKLAKIANQYLYRYKLQDAPYRFDAVSVWLNYRTRQAKIKHIESL